MRTLAQNGIRRARPLKTGQTTSYGSGTGVDDGALAKGIAKAYTILTAGQFAGTTAIVVNSKTDTHSNNCVLDNNTGLMWSRYASDSVGPASNGLLPWTTTGADATAEGLFPYCLAANAAGLGGYSDWRVPNILSLLTLMDFEAPTALPDSTAFPSFPSSTFGSSTTTPTATTDALVANFAAAIVQSSTKTVTRRLILVRGG